MRAASDQFRLDLSGGEPAPDEEGVGQVDGGQVRDRIEVQPQALYGQPGQTAGLKAQVEFGTRLDLIRTAVVRIDDVAGGWGRHLRHLARCGPPSGPRAAVGPPCCNRAPVLGRRGPIRIASRLPAAPGRSAKKPGDQGHRASSAESWGGSGSSFVVECRPHRTGRSSDETLSRSAMLRGAPVARPRSGRVQWSDAEPVARTAGHAPTRGRRRRHRARRSSAGGHRCGVRRRRRPIPDRQCGLGRAGLAGTRLGSGRHRLRLCADRLPPGSGPAAAQRLEGARAGALGARPQPWLPALPAPALPSRR